MLFSEFPRLVIYKYFDFCSMRVDPSKTASNVRTLEQVMIDQQAFFLFLECAYIPDTQEQCSKLLPLGCLMPFLSDALLLLEFYLLR